jgi:patatin-like phospholipase/acyl hydrolase
MSKVIYILSIDGGGIRGVIPARILQRIENDPDINKNGDNTFIYNKFDVFAGSSSGSMLVGGLSYHKSSMTHIIDNYINFENFIKIVPNNYRHIGIVCLSIFIIIFCVCIGFYLSQTFIGISVGILSGVIATSIISIILLFDTPLYPKYGKTKMIEDYLGKNTLFTTENGKDVFITTYNMSKQRPEFFKSWDQNNYLIKDIIDASSAVPGLYSAIKINNSFYIDGGVTTNNPTDCVYSEILKKYKNDNVKIKILSIGCGRKKQFKVNNNIVDWGHLRWIISGNVGLFIGDEQMVDTRVKNFTDVLGDKYIRIDGEIDNLLFTETSNVYKNTLNDIADLWYEENRNLLVDFFDK